MSNLGLHPRVLNDDKKFPVQHVHVSSTCGREAKKLWKVKNSGKEVSPFLIPPKRGSGCLKSTGKGLREVGGLSPRKSPIGLDLPPVSHVTPHPPTHGWGSRNEATVGLLFGFKEATEMHGINSFLKPHSLRNSVQFPLKYAEWCIILQFLPHALGIPYSHKNSRPLLTLKCQTLF